MKLVILSATVTAACAFAPSSHVGMQTSLRMSDPETGEETTLLTPEQQEFQGEVTPPARKQISINGWTPDDSLPCYGLPGVIAPTGFFDPLGFAQSGITLNDVKRNREAEVQHGRVAMLATVGYLAGEAIPGPFNLAGPANDQLQQLPTPVLVAGAGFIAATEIRRAQIGWVEPNLGSWTKTLWALRDNYYPGDVGFDPLGLKPTDAKDFATMQTRELQNGRLAMLGIAGMCSQELVNHRGIFETFSFYSKIYGGENPYAVCGPETIC